MVDKFDPHEFYFPDGATAHSAFNAQKALYCSEYYEDLLPYFATLESRFIQKRNGENAKYTIKKARLLASKLIKHIAMHVSSPLYNKLYADVLIAANCSRLSEMKMMACIVQGLANNNYSVIYLANEERDEYKYIRNFIESNKLHDVTLVDPYSLRISVFKYLRVIAAYEHAISDFKKVLKILPDDIMLTEGSLSAMAHVTATIDMWKAISHLFDYRAVFVRNHWQIASACIALDAIKRGNPVITTQHGVVSAKCSFSPIIATHQLCFGDASINVLENIERELSESAKRPSYCKSYIPIGATFDEIKKLDNQQYYKTLLVIDQHTKWSEEFYGIGFEYEAFAKLIESIASNNADIGLDKIIIRRHPDSLDAIEWLELENKYPSLIKISTKPSLIEDIGRSSISIGLFSGAQTTAAACGLPSFFVRDNGWYYTPDLYPFYNNFFIQSSHVADLIKILVADKDKYSEYRDKAFECAEKFYYKGGSYDLEDIFKRLKL
jgi:hypothetical protein